MTGDDQPLRLRLLAAEVELCRLATRAQGWVGAGRLFRAASRLGDGPAWFALAILLPLLLGLEALPTVARMAVVGIVAGVVSKALKRAFVRPRPYLAHDRIALGAAPLDRWSFPSGHTLHAVAFSVVVVARHPELALVLLPFTALVAASRVVLGLHYPSDVGAGAALGGLVGAGVLAWL